MTTHIFPSDVTECPDGLQCTSSIPSHYKRYSHSLLAHSRAMKDSIDTVPVQTGTVTKVISDLRSVRNVAAVSSTESSVDSAVNVSTSSSQSSSSGEGLMGTPNKTNALLLLRSPNTDDIKKKKGWSSSTRQSQFQSSSQEARTSTPVKPPIEVKEEISAFIDDDYISYSPLSELPDADEEQTSRKTKKELVFHDTVRGVENQVDEDSLQLFDDYDDDELFMNMLDHSETNMEHGQQNSLNTCVKLETSLTPGSHLMYSSFTGVSDEKFKHGPFTQSEKSSTNSKFTDTELQSPQSLVLERLRERISNPAHINSLGSEATDTNISQDLFYTQTAISATQKTLSMAPRRTQTKGGPSGLKQTDIGVFFGLKPLTQSKGEEEVDSTPKETDQQARIVQANGQDAKRAGRRRRKNEVFNVSPAAEDGTAQPTQAEGGRGGRAAGWKRWNRERATDGDPKVHKCCPFYKKIPGL